MASVEDVNIIELPKFLDARGNLSFAENWKQIPFEIKRTYWIYDVPGGEDRGGHAFKENQEVVIALSGAFDVVVDDGENRKVFSLNRSYYGLYIPRGFAHGFASLEDNTVMLYQCDGKYDKETDTGIRFDDPDIGIEWPIGESVAIHSERDMKLSSFKEFDTSFDMT